MLHFRSVAVATAMMLISPMGSIVAAEAQGTVVGSAHSAARPITIKVYSPSHVPLNRPAIAAKGRVLHAGAGKLIVLQRKVGRHWKVVTRKHLARGGRFQFRVRHTTVGFKMYRVAVRRSSGTVLKSARTRLHVHRFPPPGAAPVPPAPPTPTNNAANGRRVGVRAETRLGALNCFSNTMTQVAPPPQVFWTGFVSWTVGWWFYRSGAASPQFLGYGKSAYGNADASGRVTHLSFMGGTEWYRWDNGLEINEGGELFEWTGVQKGDWFAAANYLQPTGSSWSFAGYSPGQLGVWCRV